MPGAEHHAFHSSRRDKVMGVIVLAALLGIFYLSFYGTELRGVGNDDKYYTRLSKSYGISAGGAISLSGVGVGSVQAVTLEPDGQVLLSLYLNPEYRQFYREGSLLQIDSQLALGNVISGNGLIYIPGVSGAPALTFGAMIPAEEPQSLENLMEEWNIRQLAETVQEIVRDIGELVASVNDNQVKLITTLSHTAEVSANMAEATAQVPQLITDINALLLTVNGTIEQLGGDASAISNEVAQVMQNTGELTASLTLLTDSIAPTAERSPVLMDNLIQVSRETEVLLNKLNQHWLLGGTDTAISPVQRLDLPPDDALYAQ
jgi:ABC-type transporter Mla subunit MlaD